MNTPTLRFPGFVGEWEEKRLGDLLTFKNGINATKEQYGSGYKFINVLDIINNDIIMYDDIIGSVNVTEKIFERSNVVYGDILFQRSSEVREEAGQTNVYLDKDTPCTFGGFVIRGHQKVDYNPEYMNYMLKTEHARKEITQKSNGSTRYNVGQETLLNVSIIIAPLPEQQKIAAFLSAVDAKIAQLSQKGVLLGEYKRGVMQGIFMNKNSVENEKLRVESEGCADNSQLSTVHSPLRFRADDGSVFGDWVERRLGKVFEQRTEKNSGTLELLSVTINDGVKKRSELEGKDNSSKDKSNYRRVLKDDIVYNSMRMWQGANGVSLYDGIVSPAYTVLKSNKLNDSKYFGYYFKLNKMIQIFQRNSQGLTSDTWNLKYPQLSTIKIQVPSLKEQTKIANFLSAIDTKISQNTQSLEKMKTFKRGLLQQMFA